MEDAIRTTIDQYADMERCYETSELVQAIADGIRQKYDVKPKEAPFSQRVKINAVEDSLFHGETFDPKRDDKRLRGQLKRVYDVMKKGDWLTLSEIRAMIGRGTETSLSARIRDFRKMGMQVDAERMSGGLWKYRLVVEESLLSVA